MGHALLLAKGFADGQPVAVLLPDELTDGTQLPILQLDHAFTTLGGAVFALGPAESSTEHSTVALCREHGCGWRCVRLSTLEALTALSGHVRAAHDPHGRTATALRRHAEQMFDLLAGGV